MKAFTLNIVAGGKGVSSFVVLCMSPLYRRGVLLLLSRLGWVTWRASVAKIGWLKLCIGSVVVDSPVDRQCRWLLAVVLVGSMMCNPYPASLAYPFSLPSICCRFLSDVPPVVARMYVFVFTFLGLHERSHAAPQAGHQPG